MYTMLYPWLSALCMCSDNYATLLGCAPDVAGGRANCLRSKTPGELMEPYTSWFCPPGYPRPKDPWCNISLGLDSPVSSSISPAPSESIRLLPTVAFANLTEPPY